MTKKKVEKQRKWFPKCRAATFSHKCEKRNKTRERKLHNSKEE